MNKIHLQHIFKKYIDNFEMLNSKHGENYKWEIANDFQSFDVDADDFLSELKRIAKASKNMVENAGQIPFSALVNYVENHGETETVREMFRELFSNEHCSLKEKQKKIDTFIEKSEELRQKYVPDSYLYKINQGIVMQMLFLRYPDSSYGYKASQSKTFADCIEFYDDWGPMTNFKLEIFYRMCDQILKEIKADSALMETHKSRYECSDSFYADENLHILLYDIIYSSQTYNFYEGVSFEPITEKTRKLRNEKIAEAKKLESILVNIRSKKELLEEGEKYLRETLIEGLALHHNKYGDGEIAGLENYSVVIRFTKTKESRKFDLSIVVPKNIVIFDDPTISEKILKYLPALKNKDEIPKKLAEAEKNLQPYLEYLE